MDPLAAIEAAMRPRSLRASATRARSRRTAAPLRAGSTRPIA